MSVDGYIADEYGGINWLSDHQEDESMKGYIDFLQSVDTLIMGNATYQQVLTFGNWEYSDKKCYVFSSTQTGENEYVQFVNEDVRDFLHRLKEQPGNDIWLVGGAQIADAFIKNNLIDKYIIAIIPIILGNGKSLFKQFNPRIKLYLTQSLQFGQIVQLWYDVK
jgi:dihydrofolate reductase